MKKLKRSCENCLHMEYEPGDPSVGMPGEIYCGLEKLDEWCTRMYETCPSGRSEFEFLAEHCNSYDPVMADKCGFCKEPMPIPLTEVEHWCDEPFADYPVPACSEACAVASHAATERMIQEMNTPVEHDFLFDERESECPHGKNPAECNACMEYGDFKADCAREERMFGRVKGRD